MIARLPTVILAVLALVVPIIYWPGIFDFTLHPRLLSIQIGLLVGIVALIVNAQSRLAYSPVILPLLAYTVWTALSLCWSINPAESLVQINRTITFTLLTLFVLHIPKDTNILSIYLLAGLSGIVISLIGIAQYFGLAFTTLPTVGNPSATFGYRNFAASYLVVSIPFTLGFAITSRQNHLRLGWALAAVLMSLFLVYTRTRGAWLGLGVAFVIASVTLIILRRHFSKTTYTFTPKHFLFPLVCITIVGLGALLPAQMKQEGKFRFDERKTDVATTLSSTFSPNDARGRLTVWLHTLEMIRDHPITGIGIGSWQYAYPLYDKGDWITDQVAPQRPHNDLLWLFAETGLIGIGFYLWLLITLGYLVGRQLITQPNAPTTFWTLGIAIGLLALIGHSCFSFPKERIAPSFMFWLGVGAIALLTSTKSHNHTRAAWFSPLPILACSLLFTYSHLRFDGHYYQTHNAWRKQNWSLLIDHANAALSWGPFNHRVLLLKGLAYHNQNNHQEAIQAYNNAQRYHPNEGHAALGSAYAAIGDQKNAIAHYRQESLLYPNQAAAALNLAEALLTGGQVSKSIPFYRHAAERSPTPFEAWLGLGNAYQLNQEWTSALNAYEAAKKLNANHPQLYNNLGAVLTQLHRYPEAEAAYLQALKHMPTYARVHHNLGDLYRTMGDAQKAIAAYQTFIETWQGDKRFIQLAQTKIQTLQKSP